MKIRKNNLVLLIGQEGDRYLVKAKKAYFTTKDGRLDLAHLIGSKYGQTIYTHIGRPYYVVPPNFRDLLERTTRGPQIILPKDAATIIANTSLPVGGKVVDAGAGSGWLSAFLAFHVGPKGCVISYEVRKDHAELAKENHRILGLNNIKVKLKDISKGISEKDVDLVTLDIPDPWNVDCHENLRVGGYCVVYVPHQEQVVQFVSYATQKGFVIERVTETKQIDYELKDYGLRKSRKNIPHTGFLVFARKVRL